MICDATSLMCQGLSLITSEKVFSCPSADGVGSSLLVALPAIGVAVIMATCSTRAGRGWTPAVAIHLHSVHHDPAQASALLGKQQYQSRCHLPVQRCCAW